MTGIGDTVSLGLIGTGGRLRHVVKNLCAADHRIKVAAFYDPDPVSIEAMKKEFGTTPVVCQSVEELVALDSIGWVFIGSPNYRHSEQAVAALRAGKDVFCEKPLATSLEDCIAIRDAADKSGRVFALGLVLRYAEIYQNVHKLLDSGAIGELISFEFNETLGFNHGGYIFGNWRRQMKLAGSHLLEKCCHDIDLANWMSGSLPVRVASFGGRNFFISKNEHHMARLGADGKGNAAYCGWPDPHRVNPFSQGADIVDNQVVILEYANGVHATFHTNCNTAIPERRFYLCGSEGTIRANAIEGLIEWKRIGHETKIERLKLKDEGGHAGGDEHMAAGLAQTLRNGAKPLAGVAEGLRSCVAAFGVDQALAQGRVIDLIPVWRELGIEVS
jgi:predicted dehydrogenase